MEIIIDRKYKKPNYIIGNLYIAPSNSSTSPFFCPTSEAPPLRDVERGRMGGASFFCNTLEPPEGTATETVSAGSKKAIASGTYDVVLSWSPRFKKMMPYLVGVPGRSAIMIHPGNYPRDSVGCILVGSNTQKGMLTDSKKTTDMLIDLIYQTIADDEEVKVVIK